MSNLFHCKCQEHDTVKIERFQTDTELLLQGIAQDLLAMVSVFGLVTAIILWSLV